jgi:triacylglycerol lipase
MPSISANTAWALCSYVDATGKSSVPAIPIDTAWSLAWTPPSYTNENYAQVFQYTDGTYALVIQGTKNLKGILEDFEVATQHSFPSVAGAKIAKGTHEAMKKVLALEDASHTTLHTFLDGLTTGSQLLISGHSLGGNAASAFAPWIAANVAAFGGSSRQPVESLTQLPTSIQGITFAPPTAGNSALANFLNSQPNYQAYFNHHDVVPHVWGTARPLSADDIQHMYFLQDGPKCPGEVAKIVAHKLAAISAAKIEYTQTKGVFFKGAIQHQMDWFAELGYQHNTAYDTEFGQTDPART